MTSWHETAAQFGYHPMTDRLGVRCEFLDGDGRREVRYGFGFTVDEAISEALAALCGPSDPYNERRGWALDDWSAA